MIDKKDLRINNYVLYDNRPFQIYSISDEYPSLKTIEFGFGVVEWKDIKPIPITEELLVKCGFISNSYQDRYENEAIHVECDKTKGVTYLWIERMPHIKSLHQLQNIFYCLCNQELTIEI